MIFTKLEIDVMQVNELSDSIDLAIKHAMPAMVVHQNLMADALRLRNTRKGRFKLLTPIDWFKGERFSTLKFRDLPMAALDSDGFEICLTGNKLMLETRNEAQALTEFIRTHLGEYSEVRFILGTSLHSAANIATMCDGLQAVRTPNFIRNDTQLKLQVGKANPDLHNELITQIATKVTAPIKLSGNIASIKALTKCDRAQRFAVNLTSAKAIIREFYQQPEQLDSILDEPTTIEDGVATEK